MPDDYLPLRSYHLRRVIHGLNMIAEQQGDGGSPKGERNLSAVLLAALAAGKLPELLKGAIPEIPSDEVQV